jgi:hypothetical protein
MAACAADEAPMKDRRRTTVREATYCMAAILSLQLPYALMPD